MKSLKFIAAAALIITSATAFARGDGYNKSYEANQRFRENQEKIHGKKPTQAPQLTVGKTDPKPQSSKQLIEQKNKAP